MARILVIDDDALVRETLQIMLRLEGHEVALALHGEEGLRNFREQAFDLVICDTVMQRRGGTAAMSAIRRLSPDVPIIAMTDGASDLSDLRDEDNALYLNTTRSAGATATIAKPFRPRDLFALIRQCQGDAGPWPT